VKRKWLAVGLLILTGAGAAVGANQPTATEAAARRRNVVVNNPDNPKGLQIRRVRQKNEAWPDYFCEVYLWPYSAEHYNHVFTTLNQNGNKVQFIADTIFASNDHWFLVLRGTKESGILMSRNLTLESGGPAGLKLHPVDTFLRPDPAGNAWIAVVAFATPAKPVARIQSSFPLFGGAGGVHDVLDEEAARRRYSVLRDIVEYIEKIQRDQSRSIDR